MKKQTMLTVDEVRAILIEDMGDEPVSVWAGRHLISNGYVQDFLTGRSPPGKKILKALGLRRQVFYQTAQFYSRKNPE